MLLLRSLFEQRCLLAADFFGADAAGSQESAEFSKGFVAALSELTFRQFGKLP
jgi:hypothetical protein